MSLRLTAAAEADLAEIWSHVARAASEAVATGLIHRIESACLPLRNFPKLGPGRDRLAPNLRVTFEGRYAIYYTHDEHDIIVVRVLHGARDVEHIARGGGFA